ncbi:hypothetical protein MMC11_004592 [Xylographa trunciseda]|nr:hypothetical protein [Xylographa trunciseda]
MDLRGTQPCHQSVDCLLKQSEKAKDQALGIVDTYMLSVDNKLDGTLHPALDVTNTKLILNTKLHRWMEKEPEDDLDLEEFYKDVKLEEQSFRKAVEEYQTISPANIKIVIDFEKTHTMTEVWQIIDAAEQKYKLEDNSFWGRLRRAFRKLGDHNKAIGGWLGLLPEQSQYLSILCGGLKLILTAAERLKNVHDEVFTALCDIPTILSSTQRVLAMLKNSEKLHHCSSALYVAILQALSLILEYFKLNTLKKAFRGFTQQTSFEGNLTTKLEAVRYYSDAFNGEATICFHEMLKRLSEVEWNTNHVAKGVFQEVGDVKQMIQIVQQEQARANVEIMEITRANAEGIAKTIQTQTTLNEIMAMLRASPELCRTYSTKPSSDRRDLMQCLSYDKDSPQADVAANVKLAFTLPLGDQNRSVYVMRSQKLMAWLSRVSSAALLVNGHCVDVQRRSPLSFVCAKLADSLQRVQHENNVLAMQFFCGEHVRWQDDSDNTPSGIINSLLGQLLKHCKRFNLDLSNVMKLGSFRKDDVDALCKRFQKVLAKLPRQTVVFAIVDGLSYYADDPEREEETDKLLGLLISLTKSSRKHSNRCIFKLLLTAPKRLRTAAIDELDEDEMLEVPERLPMGGGFTDMQWSLGAGQQIDEMP